KNRQVRKMLAKVGHPALRVIRYSMEEISIKEMKPGEVVEMNALDFFRNLNLKSDDRRARVVNFSKSKFRRYEK
ncbi:MAG: hypothetical protein ACHQD9_09410, partial [Chitinophagales bacterium]